MTFGVWAAALVTVLAGIASVRGEIIFSQDFSGSAAVSSYVSENPDAGQWNGIVGGSIVDGGLNFTRGTAVRSFTRSTDLTPAADAVIFRFDINVIGPTSKTTDAAVWQVGSGFSTITTGRENNAKVHSQFAINFKDIYASYTFRDPRTGTDYTAKSFGRKFAITWVINNSGGALQYAAPNNTVRTIGNDQWDLWCGSDAVLLGRGATSPSQPLTDLKFAYTAGSGTIWMDNFSIEAVPAVPEPAGTGLMAAVFLAAFAVASNVKVRRRSRISKTSANRTSPLQAKEILVARSCAERFEN